MHSACEQWKLESLQALNLRRQLHGSPPLSWSEDCYWEARVQAKACQRQVSLSKSSDSYGQTIFSSASLSGSSSSSARAPSAEEAVAAWYDEGKHYNYSLGSFSRETSCFTQMIWKSTTSVGMAVS